jgi:hypothetical protein
MSGDINRLLESICIRNASKFAAELEQSLGIKLKPSCQKHEYVYDAVFDFCSTAKDLQKRILEFVKHQTMFSIEKCTRRFAWLHVTFKFHPENAV